MTRTTHADAANPTESLAALHTAARESLPASALPAGREPAAPAARRSAEQALRGELDEVCRQLEQLKQQLRASRRLMSLGTAAAMLAHEYNNQMTPVVGYARSAVDSHDVEFMRKALRLTLKHCATVTAMSDRILGLAAPAPAAPASVALRPALDEAVACLGRDPAKDGITVNVDVPAELRVRADARQVQQVFFNLLINARDAMTPGGGRLTLRAAPHADHTVRIEVRDTGCGIAPADLPHIFEPFVSTKSSADSPRRQGHGLGLAICKDIITEHGGQIDVESRRGEGTTFIIHLPAGD